MASPSLANILTITEGPVSYPSTLTDWSTNLLFPQFNTSLGTLDTVQLILSSGMTTTLTVVNGAASSSNGHAKTELEILLADPNLVSSDLDYLSPSYAYTLASGASVMSGLLPASSSSNVTYTATPVLTEFTGSGNYSLAVSTFTQTDLSNFGGNTTSSQVTNASVSAEIIYTYTTPASTATPEPASLLLMGSALLVAGLLRKRIKAKA